MEKKIKKTDDEWKAQLTKEEYRVCRLGATEMPFSGKFVKKKDAGTYVCICCGNPLFSSDTKFDSGTGWPSFYDSIQYGQVILHKDASYGIHRVEVRCAQCDAHLGHVFDDGPKEQTGKRYCINSTSLDFKNKEE